MNDYYGPRDRSENEGNIFELSEQSYDIGPGSEAHQTASGGDSTVSAVLLEAAAAAAAAVEASMPVATSLSKAGRFERRVGAVAASGRFERRAAIDTAASGRLDGCEDVGAAASGRFESRDLDGSSVTGFAEPPPPPVAAVGTHAPLWPPILRIQ